MKNSADMLVLSPRQQGWRRTGVEARAAVTMLIAFDTGCLLDIVAHQHTGYLAKAFDTEDLTAGI